MIKSINKYLWSTYYLLDGNIVARNREVNKIKSLVSGAYSLMYNR